MYKQARYEGNRINQYTLIGTFEDSTEAVILPEDVGLGFWHFEDIFIKPVLKGDSKKILSAVDLYKDKNQQDPVEFRLENQPIVLTRDGVHQPSVETVSSIDVAELKGNL